MDTITLLAPGASPAAQPQPLPHGINSAEAEFSPESAVEFVLHIIGPTTLVAIHPDRGMGPGFWLDGNTATAATNWINRQNGDGYNIYYTLNRPRIGLQKKPARDDIERLNGIGGDVDAKGGRTMAEALSAIESISLPPSSIIMTGGGYQPVWLLSDPILPSSAERVEAIGKVIAAQTGGDAVQSIDHIFRLPFTRNYPDKKKREAGRDVALAYVHKTSGARYTLDQIEAAVRPTTIATVVTPSADTIQIPGTPPTVSAGWVSTITANAKAGVPDGPFEQCTPEQQNEFLRKLAEDPEFVKRADAGRDDWRNDVFAFAHAERCGATEARPIAEKWSRTSQKFDQRGFDGCYNAKGSGITVGRLIEIARKIGVPPPWDTLVHAGVTTVVNSVDWRNKLQRNDKNKALPTLANAITAAREAPEFRGLAFDEFHQRTVIRGGSPWPHLPGNDWTDAHDLCMADWLQRNGIMVGADIAGQAVEKVARESPFHPVREYLDALRWDGTPRLDTWMCDYLGAKNERFVRAVGTKAMIAAAARIYEPGCKADNVLILEGRQDLGKSTAISTLARPWFTDDVRDLGTKDSAMQISGAWIAELAELSALTRTEVSAAKAFASRQVDRFRPPYGRRVIEQPRQGVLWGTSNNSQYLRDETGGRRWWPVHCTRVDIAGIAQARDQLWAEAVHRYRAGERWWLEDPKLKQAAKAEQDARYQGDAWREVIEKFVYGKQSVTVGETLAGAICKPHDDWSRGDQMRVAECLTSMGWGRANITRMPGAGQQWCYVPPGHKSHPDRQKRATKRRN